MDVYDELARVVGTTADRIIDGRWYFGMEWTDKAGELYAALLERDASGEWTEVARFRGELRSDNPDDPVG